MSGEFMGLFNLFCIKPSQRDFENAQKRLGQMPVEIGVSKLKYGFLFILSIVLLALSLKNGPDDTSLNSGSALWFLLAAGFFTYMLSPLGPNLKLNETGFEARNIFKTIKKDWSQIDDLRAMNMHGTKFISWKDARDPMIDKPEGFFSKIIGYSGVFNNDYEISNRELLALMMLIKNRQYGCSMRQEQNYQSTYSQYNNGIINSFGRRT